MRVSSISQSKKLKRMSQKELERTSEKKEGSSRAVKNPIFRVHRRYWSSVTLSQRSVSYSISTIFYRIIPCDALYGVRSNARPYIFGDAYEEPWRAGKKKESKSLTEMTLRIYLEKRVTNNRKRQSYGANSDLYQNLELGRSCVLL